MRCKARSKVTDGYGNSFDRSGVCKAGDACVVVRTVDNCEWPSGGGREKGQAGGAGPGLKLAG